MKKYKLLGPAGPYESDAPGSLGGNGHAKIYGRLDCPSALRAVKGGDTYQKHRVFFENEEMAKASGYRPCGNCMRAEYRAWKERRGAVSDTLADEAGTRAVGAARTEVPSGNGPAPAVVVGFPPPLRST